MSLSQIEAIQIAAVVLLLAGSTVACADAESPNVSPEALELHRSAIVIDLHSDTTPNFEDPDWDFAEEHASGDMDLPRIRRGGLDAQFWSIYMGQRDAEGSAIREAIARIDAVHELARRYPDDVALATTAAEVRAAVAAGKLASLMGVEGGHIIEESLPALRTYYRLGVRYMTLTHSFNTTWADSSGTNDPVEPLHGGLTDFGREVVREMNRLGMMVDVSHVSDDTFYDALEVSTSPVIASHSSCRAIADHPRNLTDDMLRALAKNGGVVMINFYPGYIDTDAARAIRAHRDGLRERMEAIDAELADDPVARRDARRALFEANPWPQAPLERLLDHFDHAIEIAGPDHVGLGADWDGVPSMPRGLDDVSQLPKLTQGLLDRGHSPETVRKVLGENLLRVMAENERRAERAKKGPTAATAR